MSKKFTLITALISLPFLAGVVQAADLNGEAFGKYFGALSVDVFPGVQVADFDSPNCSDVDEICLVEGFSWSDAIGWSVWTGKEIKSDVEGNGGDFPLENFAKMSYNGSFDGFIWGEKTGWINLSVCSGSTNAPDCDSKPYCQWNANDWCTLDTDGLMPSVETQNALEWGVYVDFCSLKPNQATCESQISNPYCNWEANSCVFDQENNPDGEPLRGFAWSEHLGWIKFGAEPGDDFKGVFINWLADQTPPEVNILEENTWIPNASEQGTISWTDFASEEQSQINLNESDVDYTLDGSPGFQNCITQVGDSALITQVGNSVNVDFPLIGQIQASVPNHHCRYELTGEIHNNQGAAYYFGSNAKERAANDGVDLVEPAPNVILDETFFLSTIPGAFDASTSGVFLSDNNLADGVDTAQVIVLPSDIGGSPIFDIPFKLDGSSTNDPNQAVRNVYVGYNFDATNYYFDSVNVANNFEFNYPAPLIIEGAIYETPGELSFPKNGPASGNEFLGGYGLEVTPLAPTTGTDNELWMSGFDFETNTQAGLNSLPKVSDSLGPFPMQSNLLIDANLMGDLPQAFNIQPALEVVNGELSDDEISLGQDIQATFTLKNGSSNLNADQYAIDHVFDFEDLNEGIGEEVLEVRNINLTPPADVGMGRTDHMFSATRYQLVHDEIDLDLSANAFHTKNQHYHAPFYAFEFDNNGVDLAGEYDSDGSYYAAPDQEGPYPPTIIDRTDDLAVFMPPNAEEKYSVNLTPAQHIGQNINVEVVFGVQQYVAYKTDSPIDLFTLYEAASFIENIELESIGIDTSGVVAGSQIFEPINDRDLDNVTVTTSADLRAQMRRNVAQLTRNLSLENCGAQKTLNELPTTPSDCVIVDEQNKSIIAVYTAKNEGDTLTLQNPTDITIPDYKYTLILLEGANLYLADNMVYDENHANSSFGMITIQGEQGTGANVYLDPDPTNIVGLLHAEGSLLSSPDGGQTVYYANGPSSAELKNQLYWQGSIASRNTVGGAPNNVRPRGVDCTLWPDVDSCSQAYDLDFLRRFSVIYDEVEGVYASTEKSFFSGGGFCNFQAPINCELGPLPTTVVLTQDTTIDVEQSLSLDTLFIERDNKSAPPGFTNVDSFTSTQEIR